MFYINIDRTYAFFIFSIINNLIGMIPYSFASTSHFILTFSLSFTVVLGATVLGFMKDCLCYCSHLLVSLYLKYKLVICFANICICLILLCRWASIFYCVVEPLYFIVSVSLYSLLYRWDSIPFLNEYALHFGEPFIYGGNGEPSQDGVILIHHLLIHHLKVRYHLWYIRGMRNMIRLRKAIQTLAIQVSII